jgi:GNAT superfamily N-acetyltransferase
MLTLTKTCDPTDTSFVRDLLSELRHFYPDFERWFDTACSPQFATGEATLIVARNKGVIVGAAIGKNTAQEVKLRCVYVAPAWRHHGVGIRQVKAMLDDLRCPRPHCTVAEEMIHEFCRLFVNHFGFELSRVDKSRYRPGKLEYVFNDVPRSPDAKMRI